MDLIEEIKSKLNIIDVVKDFGIVIEKNNFISSIFKDESNPSLKLYPQTNSFYDFSTGKGGDVINFYADYNRITNSEAVKELAIKFGLNSMREKQKIAEDGIREKQILIYESLEKFCNGINDKVLSYLTGPKRGLTEETIKKFRLFSIDDKDSAVSFLKEDFSMEDLKIAGLFNQKERFVFGLHKIIIPYLESGKIKYLRGRVLEEEARVGKYIGLCNAAGNLGAKRFFNKDILIEMKEGSELMICEGEFDTMIASQFGLKAVGIPGVTNFPNRCIKELERYSIYLVFDSDEAGQKAMNQIAKLFNKRILGIKLKKHKDLTEYIIDTTNN